MAQDARSVDPRSDQVPVDACPICGGGSLIPIAERADGVPVLRCERCGMGVVAWRPADTSVLYGDAYYGLEEVGAGTGATGYVDYELVASHSLAWVAELVRLLRPDGRILDVGCADGHLLRRLGDDYDRYGIEVNERLLRQCEQAGIRMLGRDVCDPALSGSWSGRFDVITAIAVLEHVVDLRGALAQLRDLLADRGVLVFEIPLLSPTHDNSAWFESSLEHVFYPTPEGLENLFRDVFALPLIGRELPISGYASTFVGLATRDEEQHARLAAWFHHLVDAPLATLDDSERRFRFYLDVIHAASPTPEHAPLLAEISPRELTPELLHRVSEVWKADLQRSDSLRRAIEQRDVRELVTLAQRTEELAAESARASSLESEVRQLAEAVRDGQSEARAWQLRAEDLHRQSLDGQEKAAAWQQASERWEQQAGDWQEKAAAWQQTSESWQQQAGDWQEKAETWRQGSVEWQRLAEERAAEVARLEAANKGLETRVTTSEAYQAALREMATVLQNDVDAAQARSRQLDEEAKRLRAELARRENRLQELFASTSWRMTAPLRFVGRQGRAALQRRPLRSDGLIWRFLRSLYRSAPMSPVTKQRLLDSLIRRGLLVPVKPWNLPVASHDAGAATPPLITHTEAWPLSAPLVSVVIPCVEYGRFVAAAVDSVLAQTFQDFEIIVVDGGSQDPESIAALRALDRPKTTVCWREGRHMVGDNRNFGIARAQGKYVCCLDADDMLRPTYLEKAVYLLETAAYDLVSTSSQCFGEDATVYDLAQHPTLSDMLAGNHVTTCAVFQRSLWADAGGFRDHGRGVDYVYEDWRLWIRFAALGARIANIVGEPLFRYRVHPASLSRAPGVSSLAAQREAIVALEADVLTAAAYRLSQDRKRQVVEVVDPLRNLLGRVPAEDRPTILIAAPFLLVGGVERLLSEVTAHLGRRGFRLVLVTSVHFDPAFGDASDWFEEATSEIYHLPRFLHPSRWRDFAFYLLESRQPQVLWIAGSAFFYGLLDEIKARWPALRVVDSLFNTVGHTADNRRHLEAIDLNIVENREVEQWLRRAGEEPERIRLIPSGVDLARFRPAEKAASTLAALGIAPDAFVVGFSGRLAEEKRPDFFVEIAHRLRDEPRLAFLMTGAGPLEADVRQRIMRLGLDGKLQFLGKVPDVTEYLGLYDALVLPSRLDGRPVVVLESLAMGVPVICSRVGGLPELVRDDETGFLCASDDLDAFVRQIRWLANHPEEHARMKAAARRFAESTLDLRQMNESYEGVFRELLGPAASTAVALGQVSAQGRVGPPSRE